MGGPDVAHCHCGQVVGLAWAWLCQGPTRCPRLPSKGSPCFTWPSPGPSFLTGGTPRAFLVCCLRFCWITTVPLDLLHLPAPIDEVGHAPSLSQRSGSLWHSPVQKSKDSTTYGERPGSTKANNRVRPRKLKSVVLKPNTCGGREPVLEAGEHRAVRHNTRRRSLNHYNGTEPAGRLESHNRFYFPALPSILFPSGFKERLVVLCSIFCPLLACALLCFPPAVPFSAHNRFFLPWAVYYRPLAFPPTFGVCGARTCAVGGSTRSLEVLTLPSTCACPSCTKTQKNKRKGTEKQRRTRKKDKKKKDK